MCSVTGERYTYPILFSLLMYNQYDMFDWFRGLFHTPPEQETLQPADAVERFEDENTDILTTAEQQANTLRDTISDAVTDVADALHDLKSYDHDNTRVDDVTTNVAEDRLRILNNFDTSQDPEQLYDAVDSLIEELRAVSRKEQAVLDHVSGPVKEVFRQADALEERKDELGQFLDNEYSVLQARQELDDRMEQWTQLRQDHDQVQQKLDSIDTDAPRSRIKECDAELDALAEDPEQQQKEELEQEIRELQNERKQLRQDIAGAASDMQRGLKKLLYAARNGDVSLSADHLQVLETVRDGRVSQEFTTPAADVADAVTAAVDVVQQVDLGDRQQRKFRNGAEQLQELADIRSRMEKLQARIATKQEELDELTIEERRSKLERKREQARTVLQDRITKRGELEDRLQDIDAEIASVVDRMESLLNTHLHNDISLSRQESE